VTHRPLELVAARHDEPFQGRDGRLLEASLVPRDDGLTHARALGQLRLGQALLPTSPAEDLARRRRGGGVAVHGATIARSPLAGVELSTGFWPQGLVQ